VLTRMLLHEGSWNGTQIFKPETVQLFRRRQSEKSTRALGFDTRSEQGASSGDFFSMETYGHLGFTGTSIWIDPVKKVFVVFLSNRVYPDEQVSVSQFRPLLHNTVMEVLGMADRKKAVLSKEHSD
jgi:CubicO group peptidase (beta-lactamase class C family)